MKEEEEKNMSHSYGLPFCVREIQMRVTECKIQNKENEERKKVISIER